MTTTTMRVRHHVFYHTLHARRRARARHMTWFDRLVSAFSHWL
jgi:hypothetical protein